MVNKNNIKDGSDWLKKNWDDVSKKYPNQWVVANEHGVQGFSNSFEEAFNQASQKNGINMKKVVVAFIPDPNAIHQ